MSNGEELVTPHLISWVWDVYLQTHFPSFSSKVVQFGLHVSSCVAQQAKVIGIVQIFQYVGQSPLYASAFVLGLMHNAIQSDK